VKSLRARIEDGPVFGTFVKLPRPEVIELLALTGFDFVVCDYEHSQMDVGMVLETVRAARGAALPVLVRLPEIDRGLINRLLEAGAEGIQLARADADGAIRLADLLRYPPLGSRSISLAQPMAEYGNRTLEDHIAAANRDVLAVGQFETAAYAERLDEALGALDVAFIGPVDLSVDLGHPGDQDAEPVRQATATIEAAAARSGRPLGTFVAGPAAAERALARGYRFLVVTSDLGMLSAGARRALAEVRPT